MCAPDSQLVLPSSSQSHSSFRNYKGANSKNRTIGYFDTQEAAAHAVNAAIRRAGLEGRRQTNPVVDGQLVPRVCHRNGKRRREEAAPATPSTRARRR